jgi:hypothetical protein
MMADFDESSEAMSSNSFVLATWGDAPSEISFWQKYMRAVLWSLMITLGNNAMVETSAQVKKSYKSRLALPLRRSSPLRRRQARLSSAQPQPQPSPCQVTFTIVVTVFGVVSFSLVIGGVTSVISSMHALESTKARMLGR